MLLKHRDTVFFSTARINGGFKNNVISFFQNFSYGGGCANQRFQVREVMLINWCRYCDNKKVCFFKIFQLICESYIRLREITFCKLIAWINSFLHHFNAFSIDVEAYYFYLFSECKGDRK